MKPLNKLPQKDTKFYGQNIVRKLSITWKNVLCKNPNMNKPYTLFTDAGNYDLSGILTQAIDGFWWSEAHSLHIRSFSW